MKHTLLQGNLTNKIIPLLKPLVTYSVTDLTQIYKELQGSKEKEDWTRTENPSSVLNSKFEQLNLSNGLGIDLPIWFDWETSKKKTMIIGRDPQRNHDRNELIISSPFGLANKKGRYSKKNKYWEFTEPLLVGSRIYITDVYKIFAKSHLDRKTIRSLKNIHYDILKQEIEAVDPDAIITIGKDAKLAISKILDCFSDEAYLTTKQNIEIYFVPHISNMVLQNFIPIANLFLSIGKLKNDSKLEDIGKAILNNKNELFK